VDVVAAVGRALDLGGCCADEGLAGDGISTGAGASKKVSSLSSSRAPHASSILSAASPLPHSTVL